MANMNSHQNLHDTDSTAPVRTPIFDLLRQDHQDVARLFLEIEASIDPDEQLVLCQRLVRALKLHAAAEEDVFYERLEAEPASRTRMNESRDEHDELDLKLDRLARADDDTEDLPGLVAELRTAVEHHVRSEEDEVFAAAQALLDKDEARTLGAAFLARKRALAGALSTFNSDDGDLGDSPTVLPLAGVSMDPGLEDRGVGSDGSSSSSSSPPSLPGAAELDQGLEDRGVGAGPSRPERRAGQNAGNTARRRFDD